MTSIPRSRFAYDMTLIFISALIGSIFGSWSYYLQKWTEYHTTTYLQTIDYTFAVETIVLICCVVLIIYLIRPVFRLRIVPNGEEKGLVEDNQMNELVMKKLKGILESYIKTEQLVLDPQGGQSWNFVIALSAYANYMASNRVENLTAKMVIWNKRLTLATIILGIATVVITIIHYL